MNRVVKNIFITIVALTLLIGSSGFQIYKHTCAAHNFSDVSLIEIPVCINDHQAVKETDDCCKNEVEKIIVSNCCEKEPTDKKNSISIASQEIKCCISSIEGIQIQDNLFPTAEKKNLTINLIATLVSFIELNNFQTEHNLVLENNNLPPPKFGKQLLKTNHQLKIDTPIC